LPFAPARSTNFASGVYITFATGFVGLLAPASDPTSDLNGLLTAVNDHRSWFIGSAALMGLAGLAGGVFTSGLTQVHSFDDFWLEKHGPFNWKLIPGKWWARIEHSAFWASLGIATFSLLG
jgi:hypothetical protein